MPCPSPNVIGTPNAEVTDYAFRRIFTAGMLYQPSDKPELVAAVADATRKGRSLRALGSNWSFSDAGRADDVVDTAALRMFLSQPWPPATPPLDTSRVRGAGSGFLAQACARDPHFAGRHFVHVEAGMKIKDLLADLGACGLALPTMGDGAGQSLIGALSTATHGADFQVPPLIEWMRAVHLVGPAGQEWWITPQGSVFGDAALLSALPGWCPDTRILANDEAFNAVRVGVGRMGVIYSVILEVVPAYTLIEVSFEYAWNDLRAQLPTSGIVGGAPSGIFDTPMADLDAGWFRTEVLRRTVYPEGALLSTDAKFSYKPGPPKWPGVLPYFDSHPEVYTDVLWDMRVTDLAHDLRGGPTMPLRHMNLVISLATPDRCWIRRRWSRSSPVRNFGMTPGSDDPVVTAAKANKSNPPGIVEAIKDQLEDTVDLLENFFGWVCQVSQWKQLQWYLDTEIDRIANEHAARGARSGEALLYILYKLATDPVLDARSQVTSLVSGIIGQGFKIAQAGPASGGENQNMLDEHDYSLDGVQSGNSVEFHFDASSGAYLDFLDTVVNLAGVHAPVFGYLGIRFTPGATALIAMQQFPMTVAIEVATLRSRVEDFYGTFWNDLHAAANALGAIPHWGQEFRQSDAYLASRYGDRLLRWRGVLAELAAEGPGVFSTPFSREKGLEPTAGELPSDDEDDALELFLLGLEAGVD